MADMTLNNLEVRGDPEDLEVFLDAIRWHDPDRPGEERYKLVLLRPMPEVLEHTVAPSPRTRGEHAANRRAFNETGFHNWDEWQKAHWGVPGGDVYIHHEHDNGLFVYEFATEWHEMPDMFWDYIHGLFPRLVFDAWYRYGQG